MQPYRLRSPTRRRRSAVPISLTPLIDVVFILLVFFMLATSLLDWRAIELNAVRTAAPMSMEGALVVEIRPEGVRLAGEKIPSGSLPSRIREHLLRKPRRRVVAKPASGVSLQEAVRVLDALTAAGVEDLSVVRGRER